MSLFPEHHFAFPVSGKIRMVKIAWEGVMLVLSKEGGSGSRSDSQPKVLSPG